MKGEKGLPYSKKGYTPMGRQRKRKIVIIVENVIELKNLISNIIQNSCKNMRKQKKKSLFSKFEKKLC